MKYMPRQIIIKDGINKSTPCPCKNCTDRKLYCHSDCEKYAEYKEEVLRKKRSFHEAQITERLIAVDKIKGIEKHRKSGNKGAYEKRNTFKGG